MNKFDEREKSFEKKFVRDEELQFKIAARRNKYLGQWASQKLGYNLEKEKEYIQSVIKADFQEVGDEDDEMENILFLQNFDIVIINNCNLSVHAKINNFCRIG